MPDPPGFGHSNPGTPGPLRRIRMPVTGDGFGFSAISTYSLYTSRPRLGSLVPSIIHLSRGAEERLGRHTPDLRRRGNRPMLSRGGATLRWSDLRNLADGAAIPGTAVFWKKDQVHASSCRSRSLPQWVCPVPRALGRPCNLRGEFIIVINLLSTRVKIFLSFFGAGELDVIHPLHRGQPQDHDRPVLFDLVPLWKRLVSTCLG